MQRSGFRFECVVAYGLGFRGLGFRGLGFRGLLTDWFLVGNGGMDPYDSPVRVPYYSGP